MEREVETEPGIPPVDRKSPRRNRPYNEVGACPIDPVPVRVLFIRELALLRTDEAADASPRIAEIGYLENVHGDGR